METQRSELEELRVGFEKWREERRHVREIVPQALLERAQRAVAQFGLADVAAATRFDRDRLRGQSRVARRSAAKSSAAPAFSRIKLSAPAAPSQVIAELEMPTGVKLRLFTQTAEALQLLSSLCGAR